MGAHYKFNTTLKEKALRYFLHLIQVVDELPVSFSNQVLAKRLVASTAKLTTTLSFNRSESDQDSILVPLRENQIILHSIDSTKKAGLLLQSLLIQTNELIVLVEASGKPKKSNT